jgi:GNAT superfamily N-acetyltransferase
MSAASTLEVVVTYLEMSARPHAPSPPIPALKLAVLHAERISVKFYRYLYNNVGERWLWYIRRTLDDAALAATIGAPSVAVYVLYVDGEPGGYIELDRRDPENVEIVYFGLMPHAIGRGLGRWFLHWGVTAAWEGKTKRLLVNTCNLDHPRALPLYQKIGFQPIRQERKIINDPRATGIIPAASSQPG